MIPKKIIIHHSTTSDSQTFDWSAIRKYHNSFRIDGVIISQEEFFRRLAKKDGIKFDQPWGDYTGYHAGVELVNGKYEIIMGRAWNVEGAHCKGQNHDSLGICFIGNFDSFDPPKGQLLMGARLISMWIRLYKIPKEQIYGHRQFSKKTCPGMNFDLGYFKSMLII